MKFRRASEGFALPTVVITAVVMFALLVAATGTMSSSSDAINTQYYEALAADAAESGSTHATSCLNDNDQTSTWGTKQLHPNTSCSGGAACTGTANCYVVKTDSYISTYTVDPITNTGTGTQTVTITGIVNLLRKSDGSVWKTYTKTLKATTGGQVSTSQVVFGYSGSAFFATIGGDGVMRAAGYNAIGQLGNGTTTATTTPTKFNAPTSAAIVAGYANFLSVGTNMFALDSQGVAYGAGDNQYGQIGAGISGSTTSNLTTPTRVAVQSGSTVRYVAALGWTNYFLTTDNNLYAAGLCTDGMLGSNYTIDGCSNQSTPVRVNLPTPNANDSNTIPTTNIAVDRHNAYVRMAGGRVYGWGDNSNGQLGDVTFTDYSSPIKIGTYGVPGK